MTPGRYSLCVIHHGDAGLTEACLRSTLALEVEPVERILLWNDPSSPPDALSGELLAAARLVDPGENLGFAGGGNRAMQEAIDGARAAGTRLDALLLLNNDTVVDAAAPRLLLEELRRDARIAITGPRILEADGGAIWHDGGTIEWPEGRVVSRGHGEPPAAAAAEVFDVDFVCGCAPMIRRAPFEEAGGFDERYFLYHEDTDLGLRLRAGGWRLRHVPAARVWHHGSASTGEGSPTARYYRLRNRLLFSRIHSPDLAAGARARRHLRRRARLRIWRYRLAGRGAEAHAIACALADARAGRWGAWIGARGATERLSSPPG